MKKERILLTFAGADMSGKTHIATRLAELLNIDIFKFSREHDRNIDFMNMLMYTAETQIQLLEQTRVEVIFDRFVPCEWAYSQVFKRYTCEPKIFDIDTRYAKLGGVIIYCYKSPKNYLDDDMGLIETKDYDAVKEKYEEYFTKTACKVMRICTDDFDTEAQCVRILEELRKMEKIE